MHKLKYVHFLLVSFLLMSCGGENFFDSIVEVEVPEHEPNLAITAHLSNLDEISLVHVTQTIGILDNKSVEAISDATVELYGDGQLIQSYQYQELYEEQDGFGNTVTRDFYVVENPQDLQTNINYELRVVSPKYGEIRANQLLARPTPILSTYYEKEGIVDIYGDRGNEITLKFQDQGGEKNYYAVQATGFYEYESGGQTETYETSIYLSPADPTAEEGSNVLLLPDITFDGKEYELKMASFDYEEGLKKIEVVLYTITEDRYLYEKSLIRYDENDGNPFAEPVIIHENVSQGNGIFTMSAGTKDTIDF